jgi:predicted RNase H-like nuclease
LKLTDKPMDIVLGIDAAWTESQPSGVALVRRRQSRWECLAVAPSYSSFLQASRGVDFSWQERAAVDRPEVDQLITAASHLAGGEPTVVSIDMPIATIEITGRRAADREVSRRFGAQGCSTHSPNAVRPGKLGADLSQSLVAAGFCLATADTLAGTSRQLIEVYPHPALLALLRRDRRVPYKVGKSTSYWKGASIEVRINRLLDEFRSIRDGLSDHIDGIPLRIPRPGEAPSLHALKCYEDALDALVCCWVGCQYLDGNAFPLGDATAAIWCPQG